MVSVYLLTLPWLFPVYYRTDYQTDRRHNLTAVLEETSVLHILSAHHPHSVLKRDGENVWSTSVLFYLITNNFMVNLFIYFLSNYSFSSYKSLLIFYLHKLVLFLYCSLNFYNLNFFLVSCYYCTNLSWYITRFG